MTNEPVVRDERTIAVENASYRWAYILLCFGVLVSVAYRGLIRDEAAWDLLGLVILSSGAATLYQGAHRIFGRASARMALLVAVMAAGVGLAGALVLIASKSG